MRRKFTKCYKKTCSLKCLMPCLKMLKNNWTILFKMGWIFGKYVADPLTFGQFPIPFFPLSRPSCFSSMCFRVICYVTILCCTQLHTRPCARHVNRRLRLVDLHLSLNPLRIWKKGERQTKESLKIILHKNFLLTCKFSFFVFLIEVCPGIRWV